MVVDGQLLAVPISYSNWQAQIDINLGLYRKGWYGPPLAKDDVAITAQQLMHATGMVTSFPFLVAGLSQVILPKFTATDFIEAALRFNGSTSFFVPGMITRLVEALEDNITLPVRRILYGGAPFTLEEMVPSIKRLGPVLIQLYGRLEGGMAYNSKNIYIRRPGESKTNYKCEICCYFYTGLLNRQRLNN